MSMIVHGGAPSPFVRKVRVSLFEKGLEHESRELVPIPKTPELLAMNPLGKIPIFEHGDLLVPDSSVILAYLERVQPEPAMVPADPKQLARALFLEEYADTRLNEAVSPVFFQRFVRKAIFQQEPDEAIVQEALEQTLPPVLDWLESQLPEGADSFLPEFSVADIGVGVHLQSLAMTGVDIDASRWPRLARYAAAITRRPSFEKAAS
jgi:glutathione S-transferase